MSSIKTIVENAINKNHFINLLMIGSPSDEYETEIEEISEKIIINYKKNNKINFKIIKKIILNVFRKSFENMLIIDKIVDNASNEILNMIQNI